MDIQKIKARLNQLGFGNLDTSNPSFGNQTIAAVKAFQSSVGLEADGKPGAQTLAALFPVPDVHGVVDASKLKPIPDTGSFVLSIRAMQIAISQNGVREKTGKMMGKQ